MKVARLFGPGDLRLVEEPAPRPGPGEALLRVKAVGLCGSDLHYYRQGSIAGQVPQRPLVLGHEVSAVVTASDAPGLPPGTRVAVEPGLSCGRCELCREGDENLCPNVRFLASPPTDGALRQFMTYPVEALFPLPDHLSDAAGALIETLGVGVHAADLARLRLAETAFVIGAGGVGLIVARLCVVSGLTRVIVAEPVADRRRAALEQGATLAFDPTAEDAEAVVAQATGGRGADVVFEAAGAPGGAALAAAAVRIGGRIVLLGIDDEDQVAFRSSHLRRKQAPVLFCRRSRHTTARAIALAAQGLVDLDCLVSHRLPLGRVAEAFGLAATYRSGALRVVVEP